MRKVIINIDARSLRILILLFLLFTLIVLPALTSLVNMARQFASNRLADVAALALEADKNFVTGQTAQIAASSLVQQHIADGDTRELAATLAQEINKRGLTSGVGMDSRGVAIARVPFSANHGDLVGQTTSWGRSAARGEAMTTFGVGRSYPLILTAAQPFLKDGRVAGAIFGGFVLDDTYAARLKSVYLPQNPRAEVIIYSLSDGVTGSTITDEQQRRLVESHFNYGSDIVQDSFDGRFVRLREKEYVVKNIPLLTAADDRIGGLLLLVPRNQEYQRVFISLALALLFLASFLFVRGKPLHKMTALRWGMVALTLLISYGVTSVVYRTVLSIKITDLGEPKQPIYNSVLGFFPNSEIIDGRHSKQISIRLASGGEPINVVGFTVTFDPSIVSVGELILKDSVCRSDLISEKVIDNQKGTVRFSCGIPTPGFGYGIGTVVIIQFLPVKDGQTIIAFDQSKSQVLANDGLGTDVLRAAAPAKLRVVSSLEDSLPKANVAVGDQQELRAPIVFSQSHPNSAVWVASRELLFSWPATIGSDYIYDLNQTSDTTLSLASRTSVANEIKLQAPTDGQFFFHVAARQGTKIGPTAHYRVQIDTVPPSQAKLKASETSIKVGETVRFIVESADETSGVQRRPYARVYQTGKKSETLLPIDATFSVPFPDPGKYQVEVRIFDNAGNYTDTRETITVTGGSLLDRLLKFISAVFNS